MILHEFFKYGRRFRWLFLLYVGWITLTTFLTATHQAFVSNSAGMRLFAMQMEPQALPIGMVLLALTMLVLWSEDSVWDPKAFWQTRPISARDHLLAKTLWISLLGGFLPGLSGFLTTFTAQMGWAESWAFGVRQGLYFLAVGSFVSGLTLTSKCWQEIVMNLALHIPTLLLHVFCWILLGERGNHLLPWFVYLALVIASFGVSVGVALCRTGQYVSWITFLLGHSIVGLLMVGFLFLVEEPRQSPDFDKASQTIVELPLEGEYPLWGPGIKATLDRRNPDYPKLRYWYQANLLGKHAKERVFIIWTEGEMRSVGSSVGRVGMFLVSERSIGTFTMPVADGSVLVIRKSFR